MKCPKCGAENADSAEFCSLCAERLEPMQEAAPSPQRTGRPPGETYIAPGEWRGEAEVLRPKVSKVVETKIRRFHWKLIAYTVIVAIVVVWLVLSFTVWGNPSAEEVSHKLIEAMNDRDPAAFVALFMDQDETEAQNMYYRVSTYLGSSGSYDDLGLSVEQPDNYEAYIYLESGTITTSGGSTVTISRSQNMIINLENQEGMWYVTPRGTDILP
jgi:uncharacterized membrane protein YvbJ